MPAQPTLGQIAGTIALGPNAQVAVGKAGALSLSVLFPAVSGTYREQGDRVETTDTFNTGSKNIKVGLSSFTADLELQQDPLVAIHQGFGVSLAGLGMRVRGIVALWIWPFGAAAAVGYLVPYFNVMECDGDFRVQGSEPQKMRIRGESNGGYFMLGDF